MSDLCPHGIPHQHPTIICDICMDIAFGREPKEPFVKRLGKGQLEDVELKNKARRECGLSLIKITVRKCLTCGVLFESAGNRTCGCIVLSRE